MKSPKTLPQTTIAFLQERLRDEYLAHYFYKNASNFCNETGYVNAGKFFEGEANQELDHANGLMNYLVDWNTNPKILESVTSFSFSDLVDIIEKSYDLEYALLEKYNEGSRKMLVSDLNTFDFLQKYRQIQTDSVKEFSDLLNKLELIDSKDKFQLFMFERESFSG